jgi:O-acetyl-ADP-ribose deacetylase (regulator of RNase III)
MGWYRDATIELVRGDITRFEGDAIVNAANAALSGGGGVDGAIHRAAGPRLLEACRAHGATTPGSAVLTDGFDLSARWVIHAVGPVWRGGDAGEAELLASAYAKCMDRAAEAGAETIAFPCISTGAYRYPFDAAMAIAIDTVCVKLDETAVESASFYCYSAGDHERYRAELDRRFAG